eukprot:COSAG01_NODE_946_length_12533_cov_4.570532_5_plen_111_part_00
MRGGNDFALSGGRLTPGRSPSLRIMGCAQGKTVVSQQPVAGFAGVAPGTSADNNPPGGSDASTPAQQQQQEKEEAAQPHQGRETGRSQADDARGAIFAEWVANGRHVMLS